MEAEYTRTRQQVSQDRQVSLVFACFLAGRIVWWMDWRQDKKSLA